MHCTRRQAYGAASPRGMMTEASLQACRQGQAGRSRQGQAGGGKQKGRQGRLGDNGRGVNQSRWGIQMGTLAAGAAAHGPAGRPQILCHQHPAPRLLPPLLGHSHTP